MKKYWIVGLVVICLCVVIATVFGQTQSYKGTQWEYGRYTASTATKVEPPVSIDATWMWEDPYGCYVDGESPQDVWRQAGFDFGDKKVTQRHWFNFLGGKGWELVSADEEFYDTGNLSINTSTYWFKRPKR